MAIQYKIQGKSDTTAILKTELAMKKLGKTVSSINKVVGAFALAKTMQVVSKVTSGATQKFLDQNKALQQYNAAISKAGKSLENLNKLQKDISRNNFFDGDTLNNATKMAATMGLTEDQIHNVMKAATDMAASGIMPLDQAVKALSLTYSGNLGQLKKIQPELANLTKEQLEQGKAVDIVSAKYQGMADAISETFDGRNTQWQNSFSDLQAEVGGIFQKVKYFEQGKWLGPLNKLTDWINNNSTKISAFVATIPENLKVIADFTIDIFKQIFSKEWWQENGKSVGQILVSVFTAVTNTILSLFVSMMGSILDLFKNVAPSLGKAVVNGFINGIGELGKAGLQVARWMGLDYDLFAKGTNKIDDWQESASKPFEDWKSDFNKGLDRSYTDAVDRFAENFEENTAVLKEQNKAISKAAENLKNSFQTSLEDATAKINGNVTEAVENIEDGAVTVELEPAAPIVVEGKEKNSTPKKLSILEETFNNLKDVRHNIAPKVAEYKAWEAEVKKFSDENDEIIKAQRKVTKELLRGAKKYGKNAYQVDEEKWEELEQLLYEQADLHGRSAELNKKFAQVNTALAEATKVYKQAKKDYAKAAFSTFGDGMKQIALNNTGEIGQYANAGIQGAASGGPWGAVIAVALQLITDFISALSRNSDKIAFVMNYVTNLLNLVADRVAPVFEALLEPLITIFVPIGELLASIFQAIGTALIPTAETLNMLMRVIGPIISGIASLVQALSPLLAIMQILTPILNIVVGLLTWIADVIKAVCVTVSTYIGKIVADIYNWFADLVNKLEWLTHYHMNKLKNEYSDMSWSEANDKIAYEWSHLGESSVNNQLIMDSLVKDSVGSSASYTAARDIYVTINYENSYVNGDAREIAINLWSEIQDAQKLNLIA